MEKLESGLRVGFGFDWGKLFVGGVGCVVTIIWVCIRRVVWRKWVTGASRHFCGARYSGGLWW